MSAAGNDEAEEISHVLLPGEQALLVLRHHPAVLLKEAAMALAGLIVAGVLTGLLHALTIVVTVIWLLWLVPLGILGVAVYAWTEDRLVVTDRRILYLHGIITHKVVMSPLGKVTDMNLARSWTGRLLGYGTIDLQTSGQFEELRSVHYVPEPESVFLEISSMLYPGRFDD